MTELTVQSLTNAMKRGVVVVFVLVALVYSVRSVIDALYQASTEGQDSKQTPNSVTDLEVKSIVQLMRTLDVDKAKPGDIVLNWQGHTDSHETDDVAPLPLFKYVNQSLLDTPVNKALRNLAGIFKQNVSEPEEWDENDRARIHHFLDTTMATKVFAIVWDFLATKNLAPHDPEHMKSLLYTLWFGLYSRVGRAYGSSGFEHVFFGEWNYPIVEGQHSWTRFYNLEKTGKIDYKGYIIHRKNLIATIRYTWDKYSKYIGGFLIGTSPQFDFSLFTLCFLTKPGERHCHFTIDDIPLRVTSFKIEKHPYIATTFPVVP